MNDDDADGPIDPEKKARGQAIMKRAASLGMKSARQLEDAMEKTKGVQKVDRGTISKAEKGIASTSTGTYNRLEAFLDAFDYETSSEREEMDEAVGEGASDSGDTIELTVSIGALDWTATVKGPRDKPEVLTAQLAELMKVAMREAKRED